LRALLWRVWLRAGLGGEQKWDQQEGE